MNKKAQWISLALCALISISAQADWSGGLDAGAYSWNPSPKGSVGNSEIDVNTQLGLSNESLTSGWLGLEHFDTWYPSVRLDFTQITLTGSGNLDQEQVLRNAAFDGPVLSTIDFSQTDLAFYYQAYDNFITLDLGVALRFIEGFVKIERQDGRLAETARFETVLPMAFAKTHIDIPLKGWYLDLIATGISYDRSTVSDITAKLGWKRDFEFTNYSHMGAEVGYRNHLSRLHQVSNFNTDLGLQGGFVGLNLRFGF